MQPLALVDGPELVRQIFISSAFGAWHGLLTAPPFYRPLVYGTVVSGIYFVVCLAISYYVVRRRDSGE